MTAITNTNTSPSIPVEVATLLERDSRIVRVVEYTQGFVPNRYRFRAPGTARIYRAMPDGSITVVEAGYDRKRSGGRGPRFVGFSERGGRLVSV